MAIDIPKAAGLIATFNININPYTGIHIVLEAWKLFDITASSIGQLVLFQLLWPSPSPSSHSL